MLNPCVSAGEEPPPLKLWKTTSRLQFVLSLKLANLSLIFVKISGLAVDSHGNSAFWGCSSMLTSGRRVAQNWAPPFFWTPRNCFSCLKIHLLVKTFKQPSQHSWINISAMWRDYFNIIFIYLFIFKLCSLFREVGRERVREQLVGINSLLLLSGSQESNSVCQT